MHVCPHPSLPNRASMHLLPAHHMSLGTTGPEPTLGASMRSLRRVESAEAPEGRIAGRDAVPPRRIPPASSAEDEEILMKAVVQRRRLADSSASTPDPARPPCPSLRGETRCKRSMGSSLAV